MSDGTSLVTLRAGVEMVHPLGVAIIFALGPQEGNVLDDHLPVTPRRAARLEPVTGDSFLRIDRIRARRDFALMINRLPPSTLSKAQPPLRGANAIHRRVLLEAHG